MVSFNPFSLGSAQAWGARGCPLWSPLSHLITQAEGSLHHSVPERCEPRWSSHLVLSRASERCSFSIFIFLFHGTGHGIFVTRALGDGGFLSFSMCTLHTPRAALHPFVLGKKKHGLAKPSI